MVLRSSYPKKNIIFLHPAVRSYREPLFSLLSTKLNVKFLYTQRQAEGTYMSEETDRILKKTDVQYTQAREWRNFFLRGMSWDVIKLLFSNYDIYIFSSSLSVSFLFLAPLLKLRKKKIIIFDELWRYPKEVKKYYFIKPYVKFVIQKCTDAVITSGTKAKKYYVETYNYLRKKVYVAYNTSPDVNEAVNIKSLKRIQEKFDVQSCRFKLLYLGRIMPYKGLAVLIKAMQKLPQDFSLFIVGNDENAEYANYCKNLVIELKIKDRVHFLGGCSSNESAYYYMNCDFFILPTLFRLQDSVQMESWGYTINEAMSVGVPVVTTDAVGSAFDLVVDGVTGMVAKSGDYKELADKIKRLATHANLNQIKFDVIEHSKKICGYQRNFEVYLKCIVELEK